VGIDNETERRKAGLPIERWVGALLAGTTLAFAIYESAGAYLDSLHNDIELLARAQAVLTRDVEFYRAEAAAWMDRVGLVETRCNEVRERIGSGLGNRN
jgi:hypothetical protein